MIQLAETGAFTDADERNGQGQVATICRLLRCPRQAANRLETHGMLGAITEGPVDGVSRPWWCPPPPPAISQYATDGPANAPLRLLHSLAPTSGRTPMREVGKGLFARWQLANSPCSAYFSPKLQN